jgi:hypothetical protein
MTTGSAPESGGITIATARQMPISGGYAHAFAEDVLLAGSVQRAEQLGSHCFSLAGLVGKPERDRLLVVGASDVDPVRCGDIGCRRSDGAGSRTGQHLACGQTSRRRRVPRLHR